MKIRNKFIFSIVCLFSCSFILLGFAGCNDSDPNAKKVEYDNEYDWEYDREFEGEYDEYMNIDGVLDEDVWNDAQHKWLTFSENGATVSYTTYFTKKGLYIASKAEDPNMQWNARFNLADNPLNSAFCYFITSDSADNLQMFTRFRFAFDSKNKVSYEQTPFAAKSVTDKDIDSGDASEMTGEFFATWDDLNIKVNEETGKPDTVNIIPMYRVVKDPEDSTANKWIGPLFADVTRLHCYCSFNENGYISSNVASSEWGNAANGISRSDGWEFSTEQENTVTSNKGHSQAIFLSDACSDKYIFSVDMKIVQGLKGIDGSDGIFRGGICAMSEGENDFAAVLIEGTDLKDNFFKMCRLKFNGWKYSYVASGSVSSDYNYEESDHTVNIKVIKDGPNFYYFVEGEFVYFNREDDLSGKCCPGVYTLTSAATFSNPEFTDYSDNHDELRTELRKYVYLVDVSTNISGGSVAIDKTSLDKNSENLSVNVTIKPNNGYVISSFTVNGNDEIDFLINNIKDGTVSIPVTGDIEIGAEFTRFNKGNDVIKIRGEVVSEDETGYLGGVRVRAYDTSNPLFCYDLETNSQGRFEISFLKPKDGTYQIGDKSYNVGSEYSVTAYFEDGYLPVSLKLSASDADENGIISGKFIPKDKLPIIGDTPTSQVFNEDGSYTATSDSMVSTGRLMNSYDISGKSWMAEVNVKTSTLSLWQTYGIAIRYDSGNYLILGAGQRASTSALLACAFPNGAWKGEFETTNTPAILSVRNTYLSQENLNVKVTYYGEQYYLYFNDVLYRVFSADEIGVSDYGVPVAVGFGFRLDDSLPKSLTFSDWDYCVEGDAKFEDPTNDANNMLNLIGDTPTSQVINEDGSYTVTTESWASTGLLMNSYDISGKNWMAEVNVKTSTLSLWQTYGIAIRYDSGNYLILGASQRASTSALGAVAFPNGAWKGELETTNSLGISSVRNTYLSQENLNVKVTYYGEQYYLYFNDVLYRVFSADEIGVSDYGAPVAVGFGYRLDDSLPKSLTFSDWDYCVEGDAKFEDPTNDAHNMLNLIGDTPTSQVINEDGSYTVTTESWASTGLLMNSYDISGKNWMAEVNVKISTLSLWQTYGIAIRYDSGNYLILGASQRASTSALGAGALPNGAWKGELETTNSLGISSVRNTYLSQENLNVKVTYYGEQYYLYFNDVLYRVFSADEIGVSDYGVPVAVGFGYRLDDSLPKSLTFSDWNYCVEGDAKFEDPTNDARNMLNLIGDTPTSQVINEDGSYTVTADSRVSTGLLMNSYDISGKSWMAEVNVKTSTLSLWQTYGIAIRYDSGNYLILGASQRGSTSALKAGALPNGAWKGELEIIITPAISSVRNTYLSQENLNVKVTYYGEQYYVYFNDVLYRVFSASEIGVSDYGAPVAVGFGYRLDDSLPKSLTFSDWDYCVEGDAKFEDPTNDAENMLNLIGDTPTSQVINEDGSYTVTTESWASTGILTNSSDITGKSWMAEVNVKTSTLSLWQTYGIAIRYDSGNYLILGASQRASADKLYVAALPNGAWKGDFETTNSTAISSVRSTYLTQENLNVKVLYKDGNYSVYFNDVLYRVFSASEIGVSDYGAPVAVGFGYRLDDSLPKSLTFSDWDYCVEGDTKYSEFLSSQQA